MSARKSKRTRHIPHRTCVGCREVIEKRSMVRIVKSPEGVKVDLTGKAPGRGAYLHNRQTCWKKALPGSLSHALRTELAEEAIEELSAFMNSLTDE